MKRCSVIYLLTILALFFISACSPGNKSQGFVGRQFNDLAARDNGYFNARLLMTESEESLWEQQADNYEEILPIFKYGTQEQAAGVQPSMDEVMKKTSLVIDLHTKSKWADDSYFLIGKANFYKRNFTEALTAFQYVVAEYSDLKKESNSKKKKKKKDDEETSSFLQKLQHQPVADEASLWVARCLIELEGYDDASTVLSVLKSKADFPENLLSELYAVEADCFIKQGQLQSAIAPLQNSIDLLENKKLKSRYNFILAQLYESKKESDKAIASYKLVLDGKPDYTMEFYAKLNMTKLTMSNYGVKGNETVDELKALLKDEKYTEFYGMIYYVLADMALADKDREQGNEYLNKSIRTSMDDKQRSSSYLRLADLYYADPEYKLAYAYYDSTLTILQRDNERYDEIKKLHDGLKLLVEQLDIIETEKKLQYWASLSDKDLEKELEKIIVEEEERDSLTNEIIAPVIQTQGTAPGTEGAFYFYNTALRSRGYTEFKKTWGTRKLEDNWRRSDKGNFDNTEETEVDTAATETIDLTKKGLKIDDIIASLPKSPEAIAASNAKIASALFNAGMIYKDNFKNRGKAISSFDENVEKYPENLFEAQSLYQLYVLSTGQDQSEYKNELLTKYPESMYAKIIIDPDYLKSSEKKDEAIKTFYAATYDSLQEGNYPGVLNMVKLADSLFKPNPYKPKFEMLAALTLGVPDSIDKFKVELQKIALKYPQDEVGIRAQEILDYLRRGSTMDDAEKTNAVVNYTFKEDEEHYFIFVMPGSGKESTTLKNNIATFNSANFSTENLKISSLLLGKENTIVLVKSFTGIEKAMVFYHTISENEEVFKDLTKEQITPYVISKSNYVLFFKSKNVDTYEQFFQDNYLKDE